MADKPGFPEILSFGNTGYGDELAWGAAMSISIALLAYALGLLIGIIGSLGKLGGSPLTRNILNGYTTLVRAVPELILILILYYAGTAALNALFEQLGLGRIAINGFVAAVGVLGFVQGAYSTEVLRAAIQAIPIGQMEAARAYGMSPLLEFRRVTLPAMLPYALPTCGSSSPRTPPSSPWWVIPNWRWPPGRRRATPRCIWSSILWRALSIC